ncbi:TetR/AcrR family transcriptional regulator [Nocardia panacis]|uniref:TetR/AcrR family transcriptional regulator n=1 Tax=Nocardia panacis TaxID=2340916 RepID=A0A3A4L2M8_9NOCA|nr:TetR/AcrR family transcriptional regulator [Nocardia panacis]RJO76623.1 TetR/AcrR family transcriptional regulator [Nocardia panacis]
MTTSRSAATSSSGDTASGDAPTKRSDATRQALLRAARDEFAEYGLAGARVDRIAEAAGVNKERIYGLFGSKDKLFDVIIVETLQEFMAIVNPLAETDPGRYVAKLFDYHNSNPQLMRLMLWEALHRGDDAHDVDGWRAHHYEAKFERASSQFGVSKEDGGRVLLALCGLSNWNLAVPQTVRMLLGPEAATDKTATRDFMAKFARAAMTSSDLVVRQDIPSDEPAGEPAPVKELTDPVDRAAERLRTAQLAVDAAREQLADALRAANAEGAGANQLARQVSGTLSRPVVLKLLAD